MSAAESAWSNNAINIHSVENAKTAEENGLNRSGEQYSLPGKHIEEIIQGGHDCNLICRSSLAQCNGEVPESFVIKYETVSLTNMTNRGFILRKEGEQIFADGELKVMPMCFDKVAVVKAGCIGTVYPGIFRMLHSHMIWLYGSNANTHV